MSRLDNGVSTGSPHLGAEQAEETRLVYEELAALPENERALVVLCYQEGMSVSDAAEVLDVPRETLRARLARSMDDLRQRVKRRGVLLSLLLLAGVLKQGSTLAAPPTLCEALDLTLPGPPCREIPADVAPLPSEIPTPALTGIGFKAAASIAAAIALSFGAWSAWHSSSSPPAPSVVGTLSPNKQSPTMTPGLRVQATGTPAAGGAGVPARREDVFSAGETPAPPGNAADSALPNAAQPAANRDAVQKNEVAEVEEPIPLAQLPPAIRAAAAGVLDGVVLIEAEKKTAGAFVVYDIKGRLGAKDVEIRVSAGGKAWILADEEAEDAIKAKEEPGTKTKSVGTIPGAEF